MGHLDETLHSEFFFKFYFKFYAFHVVYLRIKYCYNITSVLNTVILSLELAQPGLVSSDLSVWPVSSKHPVYRMAAYFAFLTILYNLQTVVCEIVPEIPKPAPTSKPPSLKTHFFPFQCFM